MDRHREVRRTSMAAANGLSRRRQRTTSSSLRDSPEEDGGMELQETSGRLRDRGTTTTTTTTSSKKERERDRISSRNNNNNNKRRRPERLIHGNSNREDGGEESSEDSLDDEDEDDDEEMPGPGPAIRMRPPSNNNNPSSSSSILSNHHHQNLNHNNNNNNQNQNQLHHRKSFPPSNNNHNNKVLRPATTPWKVSDEMGFSVPKKARSASTKRSHECWVSGGGNGGSGELLIHRQASTSPARPTGGAVVTPASLAPGSPSSSTASIRKKLKPLGSNKHRPPKVVSSNNNNNNNKPPSSSTQDEIEIEVAEVLYGLMRQSQGPSRQEISQQRLDSKDSNDVKSSRVSSPISASPSQISKLTQNSSSSTPPMSTVAPKRKRPRPQHKFDEENSAKFGNKNGSIESEQMPKIEISSPKQVKISGSVEYDFGSQGVETKSEVGRLVVVNEESEVRDGPIVTSPKKESTAAKVDFDSENATATTTKASVVVEREETFKFDLMATPLKSSPDRDSEMGFVSDSKPTMPCSENNTEMKMEVRENVEKMTKKDVEESVLVEKKKKTEVMVEECESQKSIVDLQIDLEKQNKDSGGPNSVRQQQQQQPLQMQQQLQSKVTIRNEPKMEKVAQSNSSLPLPMTIAGWPGGLPPMGNVVGQVRPLHGMATLDGNPASSNSVQPPHFPLSQQRPKRCATHYYVARNIYYHQQVAKMNFWPAVAGSPSIYGNKPYNLNVLPPTEAAIIGSPLLGSFPGRNPIQEKVQVEGAKEKSAVVTNFIDPAQRKQLVLQQPPQQAALHGPAFIFPLNQQQATPLPANKSGASKSSTSSNAASSIASQSAAGAPGNPSTAAAGATTMSFNYANMPGNEAQYVAILQNNGYPFPVPAHKQQNQSFSVSHQVRQHEADVEDSPSTEDSRVSQIQKNAYGHNFVMPIHTKNFASMSSAALGGGGGGIPGERYQQQQPLLPNSKGGAELIPAQAFAMPFASFSGGQAVSGLDFSSMAQSHVIFQNLPEAARNGYPFAAQAAQQKKTHQSSEEGKATSDSNNVDDERKAVAGKGQPGMAQSIVFSRPDSNDPANVFPQGLIQGGSSAQSPQWKNTRPNASPGSSPSVPSTTSLKNLPQQQGRNQQGHTQISFGVNSKQGMAQHGQQIPSGNQSPSPPVVVGSPPTSNTKSAGGSPRASSTGSKVGSAPSLSSQQQTKNSSSGPSRKSSPVGAPNSNYYQQQRRQPSEQHLQQQQQPLSSSTTSSGMLSLSPSLTLAGTATSDPAKAANMKGGLPPPGLLQAAQFASQSGGHQFMPTAFPYIHSVPAVVKPAEQKQPAGE
ncbi:hypothetical protein IFM89_037548 [Coptis chinensis]|uniref:Time for coffee n=1 Tax=Coptis chinensis TaxID=261450 RepID=A0A835HWU5_9MAGN|nr:hypothetical protein IFM89_037548 [Coptis chinensis]